MTLLQTSDEESKIHSRLALQSQHPDSPASHQVANTPFIVHTSYIASSHPNYSLPLVTLPTIPSPCLHNSSLRPPSSPTSTPPASRDTTPAPTAGRPQVGTPRHQPSQHPATSQHNTMPWSVPYSLLLPGDQMASMFASYGSHYSSEHQSSGGPLPSIPSLFPSSPLLPPGMTHLHSHSSSPQVRHI